MISLADFCRRCMGRLPTEGRCTYCGSCRICGALTGNRRGRCDACRKYRAKYGRDRPAEVIQRAAIRKLGA